MWHNQVILIWMVERKEIFVWQNISKNSNDAMCYIFRLQCVNILVFTVVATVVTIVVARTHPWIHIKSPYLYFMKNYLIHRL
jgi:hypothetical protein